MRAPRLAGVLLFCAATACSLNLPADDSKSAKPAAPSAAASLTPPSPFSGTSWRNDDSTDTLEFFNTGSWHELWKKAHHRGTWKIISDKEVMIMTAKGTVWHFVISSDGKSIRRSDGMKFIRNS